MAIAAIDFASLEVRTMAHHLDEYLMVAKLCGIDHDVAMKILDEEQKKAQASVERIDFFDRARRRLSE